MVPDEGIEPNRQPPIFIIGNGFTVHRQEHQALMATTKGLEPLPLSLEGSDTIRYATWPISTYSVELVSLVPFDSVH